MNAVEKAARALLNVMETPRSRKATEAWEALRSAVMRAETLRTLGEPEGFIVCLETRHFLFEAHGSTEEEANEAMGRGLAEHGRQYQLPDDWADPYLGEFATVRFEPGKATRDGERLT